MALKYLKVNETVFKNPDALKDHYKPETIRYRDAQLRELGVNLSPVLQNGTPRHILLRGEQGTGKTTTARIVLKELSENTDHAIPVYINCLEENTTASVLRKIFTLVSQTQVSSAGIALPVLCHRLGQLLTSKNKILVLCLDDINLFRSKIHLNDTLRKLLWLHHEFPAVRISIIAIINDRHYDLHRVLDASTRSVFQHSEITYPDYTGEEIIAILSERSKNAFLPGTISPEQILTVSALVSSTQNLRLGIDLLYNSGMNAELAGKTSITDQDLRTDLEKTKEQYLENTLNEISAPEQDFFVRAAQLCEETSSASQTGGSEPKQDTLTSGALYTAMNKGKTKPISYSTFNTYIRRLSDLHLIRTYQKNLPTRGRVTEIVPQYRTETIRQVCTQKPAGIAR